MNVLKKIQELYIRSQHRFTTFTTNYPGFLCTAVDKSSFLYMYDEIFNKEIYRFKADTQTPYIIDCGSNIGLSVIYFKQLYPNATVIAFEPDPEIFVALEKNCHSAQVTHGVTLVPACVGPTDGTIPFYTDHSDGGSTVAQSSQIETTLTVPQKRLSVYIQQPVDLLKIDIEGAETVVLESIAEELSLVKNIFVEYHSFAGEKQTLTTILDVLQQAGFRYYIEQVGIQSPHIFIERKTYHGMDLQLNIYGYRVKN